MKIENSVTQQDPKKSIRITTFLSVFIPTGILTHMLLKKARKTTCIRIFMMRNALKNLILREFVVNIRVFGGKSSKLKIDYIIDSLLKLCMVTEQ